MHKVLECLVKCWTHCWAEVITVFIKKEQWWTVSVQRTLGLCLVNKLALWHVRSFHHWFFLLLWFFGLFVVFFPLRSPLPVYNLPWIPAPFSHETYFAVHFIFIVWFVSIPINAYLFLHSSATHGKSEGHHSWCQSQVNIPACLQCMVVGCASLSYLWHCLV